MTITVVFDPPLPSDSPAVFNTKAFTTLGDLNDWSTEANALAVAVNADEAALDAAVASATASASTATTQAGTATTQAGIATTQAGNASTSASTATTQAGIATTKAGEANASAIAAAASASTVSSAIVTERTATATLTNKTLTSPDINGGTIDGTVIGGAAPAAGSFTTVTASGDVSVALGSNLALPYATSRFNNIFTQNTSANLVIASGMQYAGAANGYASSYAGEWAKSAVSVEYGAVKFYADSATTVGLGAAVTPTLRATITSTGLNNTVIGATTPAAGSFTTLNATSGVLGGTVNPGYTGFVNAPTGAATFGFGVANSPTALITSDASLTTVRALGSGNLGLYAAGVEKAVLTSTGLTVTGAGTFSTGAAVGGATAGAGGLAFPATAVSVADANTLDDYEEGTWTPTQGGGLTVVGAFSSSGTYTKIGRQVTVYGQVNGGTSVTAAAGAVMCAGLPFASALQYQGAGANSTGASGFVIATAAANVYSVGASSTAGTQCFSITYTV